MNINLNYTIPTLPFFTLYYSYNTTSSNVIVSKSNMNELITGRVYYFDRHNILMGQINQIDWKDKYLYLNYY